MLRAAFGRISEHIGELLGVLGVESFFSGSWAQRGASLPPLEALLRRRSDPGRCTTVVHSRCEFCRGLG
eukprot:1078741-Pyramimonas_sp.AAC.1